MVLENFLPAYPVIRRKTLSLSDNLVSAFTLHFIIADKVTVITRKAGDPADAATKWESNGEGEFTVENTTRDHSAPTLSSLLRARTAIS